MAIIVYNRTKEDHSNNKNNFPIYRPSVLGNPYTDIKDKSTKASYVVKTREEAIERYSEYFDVMYGSNIAFTKAVDEIYELYKKGEDVYLECYCKKHLTTDPAYFEEGINCHGDIIVKKLRKRLFKEKIKNFEKEGKFCKSI